MPPLPPPSPAQATAGIQLLAGSWSGRLGFLDAEKALTVPLSLTPELEGTCGYSH